MGVVQTGIQITRAVKSAGRLRQIAGVASRHGFGDVMERLGLGSYLPSPVRRWAETGSQKSFPERLRDAFEELGPTFIKLGQVLSMRPDLIPESMVEELKKLQDQVTPVPFSEIQEVINRELGRNWRDVFKTIEADAMATASIGQVHAAELLSGEEVVIKVLRPGMRKVIETDVGLMTLLAEMFEKYIPETRILNPKVFVEEFFTTLIHELDFKIEANNIQKVALNLSSYSELKIPRVYREISTSEILVLERIRGIRLNDTEGVLMSPIDRKYLAKVGAKAFLNSVLKDGLFHGDLHGGNLFLIPKAFPDDVERLGIIDFGIVGRISRRSRDQLAIMVWALIEEDYETLCYSYAELGAVDAAIDFDAFSREVRNVLSPYLGLNISEVNSGRVLIEATKVAAKYQIRVPGEWMLVFRALLTMEGMGRMLDPEFDMVELGGELIKDVVKHQASPSRLTKDALVLGRDFLSLLEGLPRNLRWAMKKWARNDYALELKSPDLIEVKGAIDRGSRRIHRGLFSLGLLMSGAVLVIADKGPHTGEMSTPGIVFLVLGLLYGLRR